MKDFDKASQECSDFQAQLPELLGEGADVTGHPHLATCPNCELLVRDLYLIAQQAKLLLPLHDPSPAVWERIEGSVQSDAREKTAK